MNTSRIHLLVLHASPVGGSNLVLFPEREHNVSFVSLASFAEARRRHLHPTPPVSETLACRPWYVRDVCNNPYVAEK